MCISKGISDVRKMQRTYTKVLHEIYPNVIKVFFLIFCRCCSFFCFVFSNNFRFTSYKYITCAYPNVHRTTYLIMISTDDRAPYKPCMLTKINQLTDIAKYVGENLVSAMHFIYSFIYFVIFRFSFSEIARLCSFIIDKFVFCT